GEKKFEGVPRLPPRAVCSKRAVFCFHQDRIRLRRDRGLLLRGIPCIRTDKAPKEVVQNPAQIYQKSDKTDSHSLCHIDTSASCPCNFRSGAVRLSHLHVLALAAASSASHSFCQHAKPPA